MRGTMLIEHLITNYFWKSRSQAKILLDDELFKFSFSFLQPSFNGQCPLDPLFGQTGKYERAFSNGRSNRQN